MRDQADYSSTLCIFLEQQELLPSAELSRALDVARQQGRRLDRVLLQSGAAEERVLLPTLATFFGFSFSADVDANRVDVPLIEKLSLSFFTDRDILPLDGKGDAKAVLTSDPGNTSVVEELSFFLDDDFEVIVAPSYLISSLTALLNQRGQEQTPTSSIRDHGSVSSESEGDSPAVRCLDRVLAAAVQNGASDIHIETFDANYKVQFRLRGVLVDHHDASPVPAHALVARIKVLAGLNVAEVRRPQDGRIRRPVSGRVIEFRVSSVPTYAGESVVCRVLDPNALQLGWEKLGFDSDVQSGILQAIGKPGGLFLVSGPTGSGKTTTLYTALKHLQDGSKKIISVEDPVEYQMPGITQVQVHPEIGLTFGATLRAALRQDPDVILVGEIRDGETAEVACRAALVGRLVLATIHASSADVVVQRLENLGVDRFLIHEVLNGVLSQRLIPVLCSSCAGTKCAACGGTSVSGRRLFAELFLGDRLKIASGPVAKIN
ncbi:type II/IV secretion system protein [Ruegeria pomeroyi]|uniref:GspE/PulE family protein n=1 Tax=Ruegeria pomeroyi TaxID=89184 RepID=UPI001F1ED63B|nr:GspE/PulE family protein [Ruegeria pomeroyi]MCE8510911.1 type II/IV secretion system protein [Ruegeria pomeroyi]